MASQITGATEIAVHTYQALYGQAASNALLNSYVAQIGSSDGYAWANSLAAGFVATSNSDFATLLLTNLGITASTITASTLFPTPAATYTALQAALTEYLRANGVASRGTVAVQMAEQFSNMEGETTWGTYGAAATAFNAQSLANFTYSSNTANTVSAAVSTATGQTYTLTTGVDSFTGGAGNDTFIANYDSVASLQALSSLDSIDGGAGTDTLKITSTAAFTLPGTETVKNVENVSVVSASTVNTDFSGYTGLTDLTVTEVGGSAGGAVKAAATANITVVDGTAAATTISVQGGKNVAVTAAKVGLAGTINVGTATAVSGTVNVTTTELATQTVGTSDAINVKGGTTVAVTANLAGAVNNLITGGAIAVTGTSATTSVSVTQTAAATATATVSGVADGAVTIKDANQGSATKAATITSVTLANYGNSTISSNALSTLALSGKSGTLGITSGLTTETVTTLNLTVNKLTGANTITDSSNHFKTINIHAAGASTIAALADTAVTALTVDGAATATFTDATGMTTLKTVTVSGAGGVGIDVSAIGTVTDVNASASTGANTVAVKSSQTTFEGGSGVDTVTVGEVPTKAISGGAGTDELVLNVAAGTFSVPSTNTFLSGFETLGFGAAATGTYNGAGFSTVHFGPTTTGGVIVNSLAAGTALTIDGDTGQAMTYTLADSSGTADAVSITLGKASVASTTPTGALTLTSIENVSLKATGDDTGTDTLTITDTAAKSLTVTGDSAVTLTLAGATKLATVDASGAAGLVDVTAVALGTSGATVTSGAGGLTAAAGVGADTFVLTGSAAAVDTIKFADGKSVPVSYDSVKGFTNFATTTTAGDTSDHLVFTTNAPAALHADVTTATAIPTPLDTQVVIGVNLTYTTKSGIITFAGSGLSAATLPQLIGSAESIADNFGIDQVVAFQYGSDTYVVHSQHVLVSSSAPGNAADSVDHATVIDLVGVTGLTSIDVSGAAPGAHVLLVA